MNEISAKAQMLVRESPSVVFEAFVNPETMSKFWFARRDDGLEEGKTVLWYVGDSEDAPTIEVRVKQLIAPEKIVIDWGQGDSFTRVTWRIEKTEAGNSRVNIEESGFDGTSEEIVERALDSTGGFNQVIVALKALVEHDVQINVVEDHG